MKQEFLISLSSDHYEKLPHYQNYSVIIQAIINKLNKHSAAGWRIVQVDEFASYTETMLPELIHRKKLPYQSLCHIYETLPTEKIQQDGSTSGFALQSAETIDNQLIFFPDHQIAIANISYYVATGSTWSEHTVFAPSAEHVKNFIEELNNLQRESMKTNITYLVDTEEGIEKKTYGLGEQIERSDVLLDEHLKNELYRSIDEFFHDDGAFFKEYGLPYKRGILLYGSPGNGKTTLVRSITGTTDAPVVYWQITEFTGSHSVQEVFSTVERLAPAILVIEDIDSMPEHMRSTFLNILDGVHVRDGLFIIGTTNYPERIDPALINRAGRFDSTYEIVSPIEDVRKQYIEKLDRKKLLNDNATNEIAKKTKGLSISQLNELYMSIALTYHYEGIIIYDERIRQLQKQHRQATRNDWDTDSSIGF
ncbi:MULTISPECIES: ATP-binding protein [Sporosarcina]|uniref:ATPase family associated with various cellular activities (AAA) n=1 Tax=Sporosarcina newyorkensis TaxID=759851 RepID=A0A1T4XG84_9BACL|nr:MULTISPECIES: ATP-binding protein [Sporosarcina]MBY0220897.1 ATP-binding protein [Sporosarcina aquimarina]SKA88530.1 ATPase family associated with various cellular activities (AAA) [Sporosarcina newyorkensis]